MSRIAACAGALVLLAAPCSVWAAGTNCAAEATVGDKLDCLVATQIAPVLHDLDLILARGPRYLAGRLPSLQGMGDLGATMDLDTPGDFSLALGVMSGVYRRFNDEIGKDFQRLPHTLPEPLPLPAATLSVRYAVSAGLELTGRVAFVPQLEVATQDWDVSATTRIFALGARYELMAGHAWVPSLVTSVDLSYFSGYMEVGRGLTYDLIGLREAARLAGTNWETVRAGINQQYRSKNGGADILGPNDDVVVGTFFHGAPILGWDVYQASVEQRAVWGGGFWHPYVGAGLDAARGHVDSGVQLAVDLRVTRPQHFIDVAGNLKEPVLPDQNVTLESVKPRAFGLRGIVGSEFDLGQHFRLPLEAQYDLSSGSFMGALAVRYAFR